MMGGPGDIFNKHIRLAIKESITEIQEEARQTHTFHADTGSLERSIDTRFSFIGTPSGEVFLNTAKAEYGPFVHQGTKPHDIFPKKKKALRFLGKSEGSDGKDFVYTKFVHHPGTKKDPFLFDALRTKREEITQIFKSYTGKALKEVAGNVRRGGFSRTFTWK